jgi:hypothetical protein
LVRGKTRVIGEGNQNQRDYISDGYPHDPKTYFGNDGSGYAFNVGDGFKPFLIRIISCQEGKT